MKSFLGNLRFAWRSLARRPGFTAAAALVLALGIGVNATLFSLLSGVLFSPMPGVEAGGELVWVSAVWRDRARPGGLSYPDYVDYREATAELWSGLAAYSAVPLSLGTGSLGTGSRGGDREPMRLLGHLASGNYFAVLGVRPALGRFFLPEEDRAPGARPVAVLSERLWRTRYGSDPAVVGGTIVLNRRDFTVVGVAPAGFRGPELGRAADLWVPLAMAEAALPGDPGVLAARGSSWLQALGRLAPGVPLERARAALAAVAANLSHEHPQSHFLRTVRATPALGGLPPEARGELLPLAGLVAAVAGLILLIACSNVANLLLARGLGRGQEIRVRLALGAGRGRLVRELLGESLLLAALGGALGLLAAAWSADLLIALLPAADFDGLSGAGGPRLLVFTLAVAVASALLAGLAPALSATRLSPRTSLAAAGPGAGSRSRLGRALVVTQLAFSLVLLSVAGLCLGALGRAATADLGFNPAGVAALSFDLELQGYAPVERQAFLAEALERAEALPAVGSASAANLAPLSGIMVGTWIAPEAAADPDREGTPAFLNGIAPGYFRTLELPLAAGRDFTSADGSHAPAVAILNQSAAQRLFGTESAVGSRLQLDGDGGTVVEVVGVAADARYDEATEDPRPFVYLPLAQRSVLGRTTLLVRLEGDEAAALPALEGLLASIDPDLPVFETTTLASLAANRVDKQRSIGGLLSGFGGLGLVLAAVGLYGLMAQLVARRSRELGVRIALGAAPGDVLRLILGDGLRLAALGAGAGLLLALPAVPLVAGALGDLAASDLAGFLGAAALLAATAVAAAWVPARRALALDPQEVLRAE